MTLKKVLLLAFIAGSVASNAYAQQSRQDQEKACGRDASRFCKAVIDAGDMVILSCLQQNRAKLSAACAKVLKDNGV